MFNYSGEMRRGSFNNYSINGENKVALVAMKLIIFPLQQEWISINAVIVFVKAVVY